MPVPPTSPAQVEATVQAARAAGEPWAATPPADRAAALDAVAAALDTALDELVALARSETALGEARLRGEVGRTSGQLRMFAERLRDGGYVDAIITPGNPAAGRPDVRRMLVPIGPVAVFAASNFPFAFSVAGGDTASALAAGCAVVVKAHEGHPETSARTAEIVRAAFAGAGAPDDTLGIVYGVDSGRTLVVHPVIRAVGFTGSTAGGRALFDLAVGRPDPIAFFGELGSVNPVVVLPGAAQDRTAEIARGYVDSLTLGVGQFCTNPGLLFVPAGDDLPAAIAAELVSAEGGPMLTDRIRDGFRDGTTTPPWTDAALLAQGRAEGDGARPEVRTVALEAFVGDAEALGAERFGPAGLVITYDGVDELVVALASLAGNLTASIHATDDEAVDAARVGRALRPTVGRLIMNGWPTGVAVCWAMQHGGPWPASTNPGSTSVGATAIERWLVPIAYQDWPDALLPPQLQRANPLGIARTVQP
jgi:NADP-dependent aldehyde dehydrogenase